MLIAEGVAGPEKGGGGAAAASAAAASQGEFGFVSVIKLLNLHIVFLFSKDLPCQLTVQIMPLNIQIIVQSWHKFDRFIIKNWKNTNKRAMNLPLT